LLRQYWKAYRPSHWLFPGDEPNRHINPVTIYRICQQAGREAKLAKPVSPHSLRHYAASQTKPIVFIVTVSTSQLRTIRSA
jgi:integrase/recombinase XerD